MVLMQTALTELHNADTGDSENVRVLLDCGSQRSYISESLANRLGLKHGQVQEIKVVTFGSDKPKILKTPVTNVEIKLKNGDKFQISANIVPKITGTIDRRPIGFLQDENISYLLQDLPLADTIPNECEPTDVELLIGNDFYLDIILPQKIDLNQGLYLLASKLGWILTGRTSENGNDVTGPNMLILTYGQDINSESNLFTAVDRSVPKKPNLEDFWKVESIGILDSESNDTKALSNFNETLKFENGRYQVTWPWKESSPDLPVNRELAMGRLKSTVNRMRNKPDLMKSYDTVIQDQLEKGVIEKVTDEMETGMKHYIPHHAVISPGKTTKVRIVYDASAKTKGENKSLNEWLSRGPILLQDLCGILMRFRLNKIALIADIEKAFLQIGLQEDQRNVTRFIWIKDYKSPEINTKNIQEYRFCRVPFGVISSPFLLGATIDYHLSLYNNDIADKLHEDIYVDNVITGTDSVDSAVELYKSGKRMFQDASMNLRGWISNDSELNNFIPECDRGDTKNVKVLGHLWDVLNDNIRLSKPVTMQYNMVETKRTVLQQLASVYDPLGLFSPVLLQGKQFLQLLWSKNLEWDEQLSEEDKRFWSNIRLDMIDIYEYSIPRFIGTDSSFSSSRLHCFYDASQQAYTTTLYLQLFNESQNQVNLLFSKTRLAPLKGMTIPRLELMAVLIGVRCIQFVKNQLHLPISDIILWTDSQCVLKWINSEKALSTFVQNRVNEIKEHCEISFRYVSSKQNPADISSRGTKLQKLKQNHLWWYGPQWLLRSEQEWPELESSDVDKETNQKVKSEEKNSMKVEIVSLSEGNKIESNHDQSVASPMDINIDHFSTVTKLLRTTIIVLRFIKKLKKVHVSKDITSTEMNEAEQLWISHIQKIHFCKVFNDIKENRKNNLKDQLGVYIDDSGIIRCKGRLENAQMTEATRHPILLPQRDKFTELIIEKIHKQLLHAGVSQTLSHIRFKYWIPRGRATVRSVLKKCRTCKRHEGGSYKMPKMPPFPAQRVTEATPFSRTGLDYLGPLLMKTNDGPKKVWICLYTCLVTRAIHLELMNDMSSEEFLLGFRRFISHRGSPKEIISDNATQFKLANDTIQKIWIDLIKDKDVQDYSSNERIHWTFIVEMAPWMGGFYERLVGLVKRSLRKTIGRLMLSNQQLQTVLKEVEAVVNSRPLVYVGDDINSNITLTPSNFLVLNPDIGTPDLGEIDKDNDYNPYVSSSDRLLDIWKKGQKHVNTFWKIWRNEYLLSLRERNQNRLKSARIQSELDARVGDVVLIKDDLRRGCWKLGRICMLIKSRDGDIRSAKVKLPSQKIIGRPLNLLYPIECTDVVGNLDDSQTFSKVQDNPSDNTNKKSLVPRKAALDARTKIKEWMDI